MTALHVTLPVGTWTVLLPHWQKATFDLKHCIFLIAADHLMQNDAQHKNESSKLIKLTYRSICWMSLGSFLNARLPLLQISAGCQGSPWPLWHWWTPAIQQGVRPPLQTLWNSECDGERAEESQPSRCLPRNSRLSSEDPISKPHGENMWTLSKKDWKFTWTNMNKHG